MQIKHSISKPFNSRRYFFPVSLDSRVLSLFGWDSPFLEYLESFSQFCQILCCPSGPACNNLSAFSATHEDFSLSVHSSYEIMSSQMAPSPFFRTFWHEFLSCAFSWHLHVFASSCASHAWIPVRFRGPLCSMLHSLTPLVNKTPHFFRLWLELFTILPLFY